VDPDRQLVTGSVQAQVGCGTDHYTLYFAIAFDRPFNAYGTWSEDQLQPRVASAHAAHAGAYVGVPSGVQLKPALSYVSVDNALANLAAENPGWDLGAVRDSARTAWNEVLRSVEVHGGADADLQVFYTALYHAFLQPNVFSDASGDYIGFDDQVHQVPAGHAHYANIPGWDEYRSLIQLRAILAPAQTSDIIQSLVDDASQGGGGMPRWEQANRNSAGMVGDSPGAYVASAYAFGAREFDAQSALAALDFGASVAGAQSGGHRVREFGEPWLSMGYIPEQPSITLEYATDDFAIARLASALGREDVAERYLARAANWVNTFDPSSGLIAPRSASGSFARVGPGDACCGFVEGNAAQYTWMVPFDFAGLFSRMGGNAVAIGRLDAFFTDVNAGPSRPYMWVGNEPSFAAPWAYDFAGAPAKTQSAVRRIQTTMFDATASGLPGNDDGGALSAWYVFAALGMYPAVPGVGGFAIGSPSFAAIDVHVADGKLLHITNASGAEVAALNVDGAPYADAWLDWQGLAGGATLEFVPIS
jgi:predicted alpha-1,2-mannosidase